MRTDHSALKWLMSFKDSQGQGARWIEVLSTYDLEITHRPGVRHGNADSLSRYLCRQCGYEEEIDKSANVQVVKVYSASDWNSPVHLQMQDTDLKRVRELVEQKERPEYSKIKDESNVVKALCSQYKSLEVKDNVLCRMLEGDRRTNYQALMPLLERKEILRECQDATTS